MAEFTKRDDGIWRTTIRVEIDLELETVQRVAAYKRCSLKNALAEIRRLYQQEVNEVSWWRQLALDCKGQLAVIPRDETLDEPGGYQQLPAVPEKKAAKLQPEAPPPRKQRAKALPAPNAVFGGLA